VALINEVRRKSIVEIIQCTYILLKTHFTFKYYMMWISIGYNTIFLR